MNKLCAPDKPVTPDPGIDDEAKSLARCYALLLSLPIPAEAEITLAPPTPSEANTAPGPPAPVAEIEEPRAFIG